MATYISSYDLKNSLFSFFKYCNNITTSSDLDKTRDRLNLYIKNIKRLITDINLNASSCTPSLEEALECIEILEFFVQEEKDFAINIKNNITTREEPTNSVLKDYCSLKRNNLKKDRMKYFDNYYSDNTRNPCSMSLRALYKIASSISSKNEIKIFDAQCGNGYNLANLKTVLEPVNTYGLDETDFRIQDAKTQLDKIVLGTLRGSRISNKVFDILFLAPRLSIERENSISWESNEKYLLKNTSKYLKDGGLFIYTIPFYRLTSDMILYISKALCDVTLFKHEDDEEHKVTLLGYRKYNEDYESTYAYLSELTLDDIKTNKNYNKTYIVESSEIEVSLFRGSVLDMEELEAIITTDGLYDDFCNSFSKTNDVNNKPLIPFNLGQIGLVLTSGHLDGIVEETSTSNHLIKGMTVKSTTVEKEATDTNSREEITTISNIVQVNVIDGEGNIKTLL